MLVKDRIAQERRRMGLSTEQLGNLIGTNRGTISRYETGAIKTIPVDTLKKLAKVLNCDYSDFVSDDPKYCTSIPEATSQESLSDDDRVLIKWFHNLPPELQGLVKQLCHIQIVTQ